MCCYKNVTAVCFPISCLIIKWNLGKILAIKQLHVWHSSCLFIAVYSIPDVTCRVTFEGATYRGYINETASGFPCQRWDSTSPQLHSYTNAQRFPDATMSEVSNYCRNPDTAPTVWCYTTTAVRWDVCAVPMCERKWNGIWQLTSHHTVTRMNTIKQHCIFFSWRLQEKKNAILFYCIHQTDAKC